MKVVEKRVKDEMIEKPRETEGARRATGVFPGGASPTGEVASRRPDLEVVGKAERRRFTAEYKQRIVREADRCNKPGEIGALLRREGLYSSHLVTWRAARDRGGLAGLWPRKRGPKVAPRDPRDKKIAELELRSSGGRSAPSELRRWSRSKKTGRAPAGCCLLDEKLVSL